MIGLSDIRDWLKTLNVAENYYIGRLDNKKEKSLGVYNRTRSGPPVMAIGGISQSSYEVKSVSLLLHWNRNARETEAAAGELWSGLLDPGEITLGGHQVHYLKLMVPEPVFVGNDESGIYEYVIEFDLYYRR